MLLKTLVAEDVPVTRRDIVAGLNSDPNFEVVREVEDVDDAFQFLIDHPPLDVLFLDLKLIGGTAFDLLQRLRDARIVIPPVVILTGNAKPEYFEQTINSFREEIVHYLEKPVMDHWTQKREECLVNIRKRLREQRPSSITIGSQKLLVQEGNKIYVLKFEDILFLQLNGSDYAEIISQVHKDPINDNRSLTRIEQELPDDQFVRVSRTAIVNVDHVDHIILDDYETMKSYAVMDYPGQLYRIELSNRGRKRLEIAMLR